jgi:glyoxylase-like metal-dependent hydrolase (beta-lactamase superfamily II)
LVRWIPDGWSVTVELQSKDVAGTLAVARSLGHQPHDRFRMIRVSDTIWFMEPVGATDRPVLGIIKGTSLSLMIDGGNSPQHAQGFLKESSRLGIAEPDLVALTHSHCDHVFGLSALKGIVLANALTSAHIRAMNSLGWNDADVAERVRAGREDEMTAHMLGEEMPGDRSGFRIRHPDVTYESMLEVDLGGAACRLEKIGDGHAPDSTVICVPAQRVAFIGDCLYLRSDEQARIGSLLRRLLALDADVYIDSHEEQPIARKQLERRYAEPKGRTSQDKG